MRMISSGQIRYNDCFAEKWIRHLSPPEWRGNVTYFYDYVPIAAVEHAGCHTDPDVVQGWVDTIHHGKPVPPPVATITGDGAYYLHDGNHRFEALQACLPPDAFIRLAVVQPVSGFAFVKQRHRTYSDYAIQEVPTVPKAVRLLAMSVFAVALTVQLARMMPNSDSSPIFVVLLMSVVLCSRYLGWVAGLLVAMFNALCAALFLFPPILSIRIEDYRHATGFLITAICMLAVAVAMMPKAKTLQLFRAGDR
jgi:hypothetical protein